MVLMHSEEGVLSTCFVPETVVWLVIGPGSVGVHTKTYGREI